jgi:UDP-glucose 4-epimerase
MKKILITGANSYIGESFKEYAAENYTGRFEIDTIGVHGEKWHRYDFSKYDAVFHVAGIAHVSTDPKMESEYFKVNRDLTVEVGKIAKAAGVQQFIFMSSSIVYGDSIVGEDANSINLETKLSPSNFYGKSKVEAEEGLLKLSDGDFKVAILRCPMIYGPRCVKGNFPLLTKIAKVAPIFPDIENKRSALYVKNLSEFVATLVETSKSGIFLPQNPDYFKTSEVISLISRASGKKLHLSKGVNALVRFLFGKTESYKKAFGNLYYDMTSSCCDLGYQKYTLQESILDIAKEEGWR